MITFEFFFASTAFLLALFAFGDAMWPLPSRFWQWTTRKVALMWWYVKWCWENSLTAPPISRVFTANPEEETDYREAPARGLTVREIELSETEKRALNVGLACCGHTPPALDCRCVCCYGHRQWAIRTDEGRRPDPGGGPHTLPSDAGYVVTGNVNRVSVDPDVVIPLARAIVNPTVENVISLAEARRRKQSQKAMGRS